MDRDTYVMIVLGFLIGHWFGNIFLTHPGLREHIAKLEARVLVLETAARPEKVTP